MRILITTLVLLSSVASTFAQAPAPKAKAKPKVNAIAEMAKPKQVDEKLPNVLIIGDSISIGYTVAVRELLTGKANVFRPATNCGPTTTGLSGIESWLGTQKWDVIHFNWGLHDLKYVGEKPGLIVDPKSAGARQQVTTADYEKNLRQLIERLKKTGAKLIWCSTTPVPEGQTGRVPGDELKYNAIAAKVVSEAGVATDDLYGFARPKLTEIQLPKNVHYSPEGYKVLAKQVVSTIEPLLAK